MTGGVIRETNRTKDRRNSSPVPSSNKAMLAYLGVETDGFRLPFGLSVLRYSVLAFVRIP